MDKKIRRKLVKIQRGEINGQLIYSKLSNLQKDEKNKEILKEIAAEEAEHYVTFKRYTKTDVKQSKLQVTIYTIMAVLLGLTFTLKLMERLEGKTIRGYNKLIEYIPEIASIIEEEEEHEKQLLELLNEKKLNYVGSIVLGLNDALVELSGALAGFTLAIQKSRTIALMGLITGIAATLSMAASEYLSQRQETNRSEAVKSSLYTGLSYVVTVVFLILPYFLITNPFVNLGVMMGIVIIIILIFNFYISVAKDLSFKKRFFEMALISIGVALLSYGIGWLVRTYFGLQL